MRIIKLLIGLILFWVHSSYAQNDSVVFVNAHWNETNIARGILWKSAHFDSSLFQSNQHINILSVDSKKCKCGFEIGYEKEKLKPTSSFGNESKAIVALNGTFFNREKGGSIDYIRSRGIPINPNIFTKTNTRSVHQKAAVIIQSGKIAIQKWDGSTSWEEEIKAEDVMVSGPILMHRSKVEKLDSTSFTYTRHPRTVIATSPGRTLLITIDGRNGKANGMTLIELSKIVKWLGSIDALNLDGGGSTTLWIYNQPENGVVNYPSDNGLWDHDGERNVANVILIKKR